MARTNEYPRGRCTGFRHLPVRRLVGWGALLVALLVVLVGKTTQDGAATNATPTDQTQVSANSTFPEAIEEPCLPASVQFSAADPPQLEDLTVEIPKSRSWFSNVLEAYLNPTEVITDEYKKEFSATVSVTYSNGSVCSHLADVRISGDLKDHISVQGMGGARASMDVTLKDGNIDGIVRFKLLLPGTRGPGDSEILATEIFRRVGILAPRTRNVVVTVNGVETQMLMQENIAKELLESQGQRESTILEADETQFWQERAARRDYQGQLHFMFPRLSNSEWTTRGPTYNTIGWKSLQNFSRALSETWTDSSFVGQLSDTLLARGSDTDRDRLARFRALSMAMRAGHGLELTNRRFYFDPMSGVFLPIYYDGSSMLDYQPVLTSPYDLDRVRVGLRGVQRADIEAARTAIKDIDVGSLNTDLQVHGVTLEQKDLQNILNAIDSNFQTLIEISPATDDPVWTSSPHSVNPVELMLVFGPDKSVLQSCDTGLSSCQPLILNEQQERDLLRGRLVIDDTQYKFAGPSLESYIAGTDPIPEIQTGAPTAFVDQTPVFTFGQVDLQIDREKKTLDANLLGAGDRIVIRDGRIADWEINVTAPSRSISPTAIRFNENLLTGCLTLIDTDLDGVDITVRGGVCEDSLNLIRANGTVQELIIRDSHQDAIDMDFSTIESEFITVMNAGNDCLDLSAGTYTVRSFVANSCADKAVSVGEKSDVSITQALIGGANYGLVAKDSSKLSVTSATITNVKTCASAYRKKQEFGGALMNLGEVHCPVKTYTAQKGSEIRRTS